MVSDVFITCAVTGAGATADKSALVPVTPQQIADAAIEAGERGAAVVHIHVRDPATGKGARDAALYGEVVERIRSVERRRRTQPQRGHGRRPGARRR